MVSSLACVISIWSCIKLESSPIGRYSAVTGRRKNIPRKKSVGKNKTLNYTVISPNFGWSTPSNRRSVSFIFHVGNSRKIPICSQIYGKLTGEVLICCLLLTGFLIFVLKKTCFKAVRYFFYISTFKIFYLNPRLVKSHLKHKPWIKYIIQDLFLRVSWNFKGPLFL